MVDPVKTLKKDCKKRIADAHKKVVEAEKFEKKTKVACEKALAKAEKEKTRKAKPDSVKKTRKKRTPDMTDETRAKIAASPRTIQPMMPPPVPAPSLAPAAPNAGGTRRRRRHVSRW